MALGAAMALAVAAVPAQAAPSVSVSKLHAGTSVAGAEDYQFAAGQQVFPEIANYAGSSYRLTTVEPDGTTTHSVVTCSNSAPGAAGDAYTIGAGDPASTTAHWTFKLEQFPSANCAGAATAVTKAFDVAGSTTFDSSALTTQKSSFGGNGSAFVTVKGLDQGQKDWKVRWNYGAANALGCGNLAAASMHANDGTDLPNSSSSGVLPDVAPAYLQYPPSSLGTTWNLASNYDSFPIGTTCAGFNGATDGQWTLTLTLDATHFVTLPVFTVDGTRPAVTVTTPADGTATPSNFTFSGAAGTAAGDNNQVTVSLYDGNGNPIGSPQNVTPSAGTWSLSPPALGTGLYIVKATQTDSSGNTGTATSTFAVDNTAPDVSITVPSDNSGLNSGTPTFQGGAGTTDGASPDSQSVTLRIFKDGTQVDSRTVTRSGGGWQATPNAALDDGDYTAQAEQSDLAGNLGKSAVVHFSIDTHAPVVTLAQPADGSLTNDSTPTFSGTDTNGTGDQSVKVRIWSGTDTTATPARSFTVTPSGTTWSADLADADFLGNGDYTARAEQSDTAGNVGLSDYHHFTIDASAPTTSAAGGSPATASASAFAVTYTASDSGAAGLKQVELWVRTPTSNGAFQKVATDTGAAIDNTFSYTPTAGDGLYFFYTVGVDNAGNTEAAPASTSGDTFTVVDSGKPTSHATALAAATNAASIGIDYSAQDNNGGVGLDHVELWAKQGSGSFQHVGDDPAPSQTGQHFSYVPAADDTYCFYTVGVDKAGNTEDAPAGGSGDTCTTVDTGSPAPSLVQPADPGNDATPALHGTAGSQAADATHSADGGTVTVRIWSGSSVGSGAANRVISGVAVDGSGNWTLQNSDFTSGPTAPLTDGTWTARVEQSDAAGNLGTGTARTFKLDSHAPAPTMAPQPALGNSSTPGFSGTGGTQAADASHSADASTVTVRIWSGSSIGSGPADRVFSGVTLDGSGNWTIAAGDYGSGPTAPLGDGTWTVHVEQGDGAGNLGAGAAQTFKVDTAAPAPVMTQPADPGKSTTPLLSGTAGRQASDALHSGDQGTVTVRIWSGSVVGAGAADRVFSVTVDGSGNWAINPGDYSSGSTAPLGEGTWTAQVEQSDAATNLGTDTARTFKIDTSAPAPTMAQPPTPSSSQTPALSGTAGVQGPDASHSADASTVTVRIWSGSSVGSGAADRVFSGVPVDGSGNWAIAPGDYGSGSKAPLDDRTWTARVEQSDAATNLGTGTARTFEVDAQPPAPTLVQPADPGNDATPALHGIAGTQTHDDPAVTVRIWSGPSVGAGAADRVFSGVAVDGSGNWTLHAGDYGSGQKAPLGDGTWTARVEQGDAAANLGLGAPRTFTLDTVAPSVSSGNDGQTYPQGAVVAAAYSCADTAGGSGIASCTGDVANGAPLDTAAPGAHSVSLTAQDKAGNVKHVTAGYTVQATPSNPAAPGNGGGDTSGPKLSFASNPATEKLGNVVTFLFACDEDCSYSGTGTISLPGAARVHKLKAVAGRAKSGKRVTLKLKLDAGTKAAVKKALARHVKVNVKVRVVLTDARGNRTGVSRTIKLKG